MSRRRPENMMEEDGEQEDEEEESSSLSDSTHASIIDEDNADIFEAIDVLREDIGNSDDDNDSISVADGKQDGGGSSDRLFVPSPDDTPFLNVHAKEFVPNFSSSDKEGGEKKQSSVIDRVKKILMLYATGLDGNQVQLIIFRFF